MQVKSGVHWLIFANLRLPFYLAISFFVKVLFNIFAEILYDKEQAKAKSLFKNVHEPKK